MQVNHVLDVPRLGKSQGGRKWLAWNACCERPARPRFPETVKRYSRWLRKHGDVAWRRKTMKSIGAAEDGVTGSIVNRGDIADVQHQRGASTSGGSSVDVRAELFESFIGCRAKLFPPPVQLGRCAVQQGLIASRHGRAFRLPCITCDAADSHDCAIREDRSKTTSSGTGEVVQDCPGQTRETRIQRPELSNDIRRKQKARLEQFGAHFDLLNIGECSSWNPGSRRQAAARGSPETATIRATNSGGGATKHGVALESLAHGEQGFIGGFHLAVEEQQRGSVGAGPAHGLGARSDGRARRRQNPSQGCGELRDRRPAIGMDEARDSPCASCKAIR